MRYQRQCNDCQHYDVLVEEIPCRGCFGVTGKPHWLDSDLPNPPPFEPESYTDVEVMRMLLDQLIEENDDLRQRVDRLERYYT